VGVRKETLRNSKKPRLGLGANGNALAAVHGQKKEHRLSKKEKKRCGKGGEVLGSGSHSALLQVGRPRGVVFSFGVGA